MHSDHMDSLFGRLSTLFLGPYGLVTIAGVSSAFVIGLIVYRLFLHPLAGIPGPLIARATGLWRTRRYMLGTWHDDILALHKKYGRVVRIAPDEVAVVDADAMKKLYGHGGKAVKTSWYSTWGKNVKSPSLFPVQDKQIHAFLRKRIAAPYSMTGVLKYEPYMQACLDLLWERLRKHTDAGEVVNMSDWTNALAFDVIGELGYGEQLGHLRTETDYMDLRKTIYQGFFFMAGLGHVPGQSSLVQNSFVTALLRISNIPEPMGSFLTWSTARVQKRLDEIKEGKTQEREDMLAHFCRMKSIDGSPAKQEEILVEVLSLIGAGADTTSIAMRSCLYYLGQNPAVLSKLRDEIDAFHQSQESPDKIITYHQASGLPYLGAVIKEATRLFPSINFMLPRHAPPDFEVQGYRIPSSVQVGISPIAQNRDRAIWGEDADVFRPERWLEDEEHAKFLESHNMLWGGSGPRSCVGKNIALVELYKFLPQFLRQFDFEIVNPEKPWRVTTFWFSYQHDFNLRLTRRTSKA